MVFGTLKSLFGGGSQPEVPKVSTGPYGLHVGRAASFDLLRLKLEAGRLAMPIPSETLVITGHGVARLDASGLLHRYYDDDDAMLQILCGGGVDDGDIQEITLYHLWDVVSPTTAGEWASWDGPGGKIGLATFEADGFRFERVWGEPSTPWVPPAEFNEDVTVTGGDRKTLRQKIMPYRREVGSVVETLILAVERDLASQDRGSVTFMIGYGLSPSDVTPV